MNCPVDGEVLTSARYEADIQVDECAKCRGIWLDAGELQRIESTKERDYSEELKRIPDHVARAYEMARQRSQKERMCPSCGKTLERREYGYCSRITVDSCPGCQGLWLDRGELSALEVFFEAARAGAKADDERVARGFFRSLLDGLV
jgi:Zn-finger nucleic acid-binding protein